MSIIFFWLGTYGQGLDRFDPETNTFRHFRHNAKNPSSISGNIITAILNDRSGNLWVGTEDGGLNLLDKKTGKFKHYEHNPGDSTSLSYNEVRIIYEDRAGKIWVGCGRPFSNFYQAADDGGLNCLDKITGKFKRYLHNTHNATSLANNKVKSIFEDSKGNFWIGTRGDHVQILNRKTGDFTTVYFDPLDPENSNKEKKPIINTDSLGDVVSFITEDAKGNMLFGMHRLGMVYYNQLTRTITHYGNGYDKLAGGIIPKDTTTGLNSGSLWRAFTSKEGVIWITTLSGNVYTINPHQIILPSYTLNNSKPDVNSLYCEPNGNILWLGTDGGLYRRNLKTGDQQIFKHNNARLNSLCNDTIASVKPDGNGNLWLGTANGLSKFNMASNTFINYYHTNTNSLSSNAILYLFFDTDKNLWIGTNETGIDKFNIASGIFKNYRYSDTNRNSISNDAITAVSEDPDKTIWIATTYGLNSLSAKTDSIRHYFGNTFVNSVFVDASGKVWSAFEGGLYSFDNVHKVFQPYIDSNLNENFTGIINITEDKEHSLWLSAANNIIKINAQRNAVKIYDSTNGVHFNSFINADNYISNDGKIFLGDQDGFYTFYPDEVEDTSSKPAIFFTGFRINDVEEKVINVDNKPQSIADATDIKLNYRQTNISFEFNAISYAVNGSFKFLYKLENYDNNWHYLGNQHKIYFFNLQPGKYILHVKGVRKDGVYNEKTITINITPPFWQTWWFRILSVVAMVAVVYAIVQNHSRNLKKQNLQLEEIVMRRTKELQQSFEHLKSTQAQLIQQEKMASLGELTAGIAHEIQNPLNFVNNFSEVNKEMIAEMKDAIAKGNYDEVKIIANDIEANEEKINHHGKRADAIVKGMLQHSRQTSGTKEPTDINALCDEFLRLSYHGLRAKEKNFNADFKTDFDESIGKINIVPQDIGRVLLNLFNNAFYAVNEKKKSYELSAMSYEPLVSITTKKLNNKIEIIVSDNGNGISQNNIDKIFQPFFTTKPTGQGTGLGLSLAYDIITKEHNGTIKVESKEGEGSKFIIQLPIYK